MKKENVYGSLGILPKEEMLEAKQNFQKLTIGLPKETSFQENRISLSPDSVALLTHNGHKIIIENNAGEGANFSDKEYSDAGAEIVFSKDELIPYIFISDLYFPNQVNQNTHHLNYRLDRNHLRDHRHQKKNIYDHYFYPKTCPGYLFL